MDTLTDYMLLNPCLACHNTRFHLIQTPKPIISLGLLSSMHHQITFLFFTSVSAFLSSKIFTMARYPFLVAHDSAVLNSCMDRSNRMPQMRHTDHVVAQRLTSVSDISIQSQHPQWPTWVPLKKYERITQPFRLDQDPKFLYLYIFYNMSRMKSVSFVNLDTH